MAQPVRHAAVVALVFLTAGCATGTGDGPDETAAEAAECSVTEEFPAASGGTSPPRRQDEARRVHFATICPEALTLELVANLQRALMARGLFDAGVTGTYGAATGAAVKSYQSRFGLPSSTLSLRAARELGLVAYPREEITGAS